MAAGISQSAISLMERGHLATLSLRTVRAAFAAVDARFEGLVTWRGGAVHRLLDERHARLVGQVAQDLQRAGWDVHVEVTFAHFGERGSIDIVGLRPGEGVALIVEIKTELTAIDDTIRRLDVKGRLGAEIVHERFGWRPATVARLLVVLDGTTARRRVASHDRALRVAFPDRGARVRAWLRRPVGRISGLLFIGARSDVRRIPTRVVRD